LKALACALKSTLETESHVLLAIPPAVLALQRTTALAVVTLNKVLSMEAATVRMDSILIK
jgi:hypothetical protein